jgi:hypothetical protein
MTRCAVTDVGRSILASLVHLHGLGAHEDAFLHLWRFSVFSRRKLLRQIPRSDSTIGQAISPL